MLVLSCLYSLSRFAMNSISYSSSSSPFYLYVISSGISFALALCRRVNGEIPSPSNAVYDVIYRLWHII